MRKIISIILSICLLVTLSMSINQLNVRAKTIGIGSAYRYNAPTYNLGDTIFCKFPDITLGMVTDSGYSYYKMVLTSSSNIKINGRGYDPEFHFLCDILDSSGNYIEGFYSKDKTNLGYEKINGTISLSAGTYYIAIGSFLDALTDYSSEFASLTLTKINKKASPNSVSKNRKSNSANKKFKVSKKRITVKKGKRKSVAVTFKYNSGNVYYSIKNKRKISAKWGKRWKGYKIKLFIKGKKKGRTKVYITNSKNKRKIVVRVKVK